MAALLASAMLAAPGLPPDRVAEWEAFRARFVTAEGRVRDTGNEDITHSEGQAYAMLLAASLDQRADFDRTWNWTRSHLAVREDALLAWRWDPETGVVDDRNNATDGDIIAAWALVRAARRWPTGGYQRDASRLLDAIERHVVVAHRFGPIVKPGDHGFETPDGPVVNLSYWVFPAFEEIALARPAGPWRRLARSGRALLQTARFGQHGLPPDWLLLASPPVPAPGRPARFGYDALRIPLYACWAGLDRMPVLEAIRAVWQAPEPPAWIALDSTDIAPWALGPGGMAVRALLSRCLGGRAPLPPVDGTGDYYEAVLGLLARLAADEARW